MKGPNWGWGGGGVTRVRGQFCTVVSGREDSMFEQEQRRGWSVGGLYGYFVDS